MRQTGWKMELKGYVSDYLETVHGSSFLESNIRAVKVLLLNHKVFRFLTARSRTKVKMLPFDCLPSEQKFNGQSLTARKMFYPNYDGLCSLESRILVLKSTGGN